MAKGRKRKPEAVKRAQGNPGRRPLVEDQVEEDEGAQQDAPALAGSLQPPAWIDTSKALDKRSRRGKRAAELTALAHQVWHQLLPVVRQMNLVKESDLIAFGRYCRLFGEWVMYTRDIDREGPTYESSSPHVEKLIRPNPAVRFRKDCEQQLRDLEDRMGLNPAARLSLNHKMVGRQPDLPGMGDAPRPSSEGGEAPPPAAGTTRTTGFLQ